ncbi:hypothetical protein CONPUDRAFT_78119 [Coniophora puteana RWD-64-598 SS2]|uniref:Uncharacterized protein n=1 Tax=Coniophora puteana (strain RWD-64-598) TaxID=741705 RepID=R7SFF6_CONPW|nr:uncharacterized protein CONPUDRAFT_78119 [Coniophora puteana RWD-64-598 SS2]EIW74477.1 hypothetical protein CONPUDRAFT_78119 [Coniophora puteana RWD-64-598 SS2]
MEYQPEAEDHQRSRVGVRFAMTSKAFKLSKVADNYMILFVILSAYSAHNSLKIVTNLPTAAMLHRPFSQVRVAPIHGIISGILHDTILGNTIPDVGSGYRLEPRFSYSFSQYTFRNRWHRGVGHALGSRSRKRIKWALGCLFCVELFLALLGTVDAGITRFPVDNILVVNIPVIFLILGNLTEAASRWYTNINLNIFVRYALLFLETTLNEHKKAGDLGRSLSGAPDPATRGSLVQLEVFSTSPLSLSASVRSDRKNLFGRLASPDENPAFVCLHLPLINRELQSEAEKNKKSGAMVPRFTTFALECLDAGLLTTLVAIIRQRPDTDVKERYISQFWAFTLFSTLVQSGDPSERQVLTDELLHLGFVEIILQSVRHPLCIMHQAAINTAQHFGMLIGPKLSASTIADIIETMCLYALQGPDEAMKQLSDPKTRWQGTFMLLKANINRETVGIYALRWYGIFQHRALLTVEGIMCTRQSPHSRKNCLEILETRPYILDLLLDCTMLERPNKFMESRATAMATETLAIFLQWPDFVVPGTTTQTGRSPKSQEYKSVTQAVTLFTSCRDWSEKLIEAWMCIEEESSKKLERSAVSLRTSKVVDQDDE